MIQNNDKTHRSPSGQGLVGVMILRVLALTAFLFIVAFLIPADSVAFYAFMAFAFIVTIPYALWLRDRERATRLIPLQFIVDSLIATGLVYFTGGADSKLALIYPLIIVSTGMLCTPKRAIQITVLSIASYLTLMGLMTHDILVPYQPSTRSTGEHLPWHLIASNVFIFGCFGAASVYVSERFQLADRRVHQFRDMTSIIFQNVNIGLTLLNANGKILMINDRACQLLDQSKGDLEGRYVNEIMNLKTEPPSIEDAVSEGYQDLFRMKRSDGSTFPISFEMSGLSLPAEAVPNGAASGMVDVNIMVFRDISYDMEMQRKAEEMDRLQAAIRLTDEIADQICNPVAAISGSVQILQKLDARARAGDAQSKELLERSTQQIFANIFTESDRVDKIMESFADLNYQAKVRAILEHNASIENKRTA